MYDHFMEEMADAIAKELHIDNNDVLSILNRYWQDKIAHVWQVDDVLESARRAEKPIIRADAQNILHQVFEDHDSALGITWATLDVALEDYRLDFDALTPDTCKQVVGVFNVWRQYDAISHQFGLFPNQAEGNLPEALAFAEKLARDVPGVAIFLGMERYTSEEPEAWLTVRFESGEAEPSIQESEALCTPSSPDNASAS